MSIRFGLIAATAVGVELLAIVVLVLLIAILGPSDPAAAQAYAEELGYWVGPIAGAVLCLGGGWFVAKKAPSHHLWNGAALGVCVAAIDVGLLIVSGAEFAGIFVLSNIGKVIAASVGGWLGRNGARGTA